MSLTDPKLLFIYNPRAGRVKNKAELFELIEQLCGDFDPVLHFTAAQGDAVRCAYERGADFDIVAACGGDGTLSEVINGVMQLDQAVRPKIGYVPAGTTNDFAASLNLPRDMKKAAHLLKIGSVQPYDIGLIGQAHYFSYVASFGAFSSVAYATAQTLKNALGHLGYILEGVRSIGEIRPVEMTVTCAGEVRSGSYIFGAVMNSRRIAGLVQLDESVVRQNDGMHEVMLIRSPESLQELSGILKGLATQDYAHPCIEFFHAQSAVFESPASVAWGTDGEYALTQRRAEFRNCPGAIDLIGGA